MFFRKAINKIYRTCPAEYTKTYFEDGVKNAVLFRSIICEDELSVISEVTEIHTFGCNEKGKFIELPKVVNRRFFIVGERVKPFNGTLLLSVCGVCYNVYSAGDGNSLIACSAEVRQ